MRKTNIVLAILLVLVVISFAIAQTTRVGILESRVIQLEEQVSGVNLDDIFMCGVSDDGKLRCWGPSVRNGVVVIPPSWWIDAVRESRANY